MNENAIDSEINSKPVPDTAKLKSAHKAGKRNYVREEGAPLINVPK